MRAIIMVVCGNCGRVSRFFAVIDFPPWLRISQVLGKAAQRGASPPYSAAENKVVLLPLPLDKVERERERESAVACPYRTPL